MTFVTVEDSFEISKYGEYNYDNIVVFLTSSKRYDSLKKKEFRTFLEMHGNIFLAFDNSPSDFVRNLAGFSGVEIDADQSKVVDYFNAVDGDPSLFQTTDYPKNAYLVGDLSTYSDAILYRGMGMRVDENNVLAIRALGGDVTTVSVNAAGVVQRHSSAVVLVAAVQTRSNNRIVVSGSLAQFSNAFYLRSQANRRFGDALSQWSFKFAGYLRVRNVEHFKVDANGVRRQHELLVQEVKKPNLPTSHYGEPEVAGNNVVYRVKDSLYYAVLVEEWDGEQWRKFRTDDMQVEFVMLDPYVRKNLTFVADQPDVDYSTVIKVPDVYGIYKFRLFYQRQGLSLINENTQVSIRPFKHDEFPRFILAAYPYYTATMIVMIAFAAYVFTFLFVGEKEKQE
ncbi:hypothetical protein WA538_001508 [Blastocystis sp. DL]